MKLLIITQKIDKSDPVLGFFHNWVSKLAPNFEKINVICLEKGLCELPSNAEVFSLGKEKGASKLKYLLNFYRYIFGLRADYDAVFVHMNQEYVILGWKFWKILGKKIFLWRNHPKGNFLTDIAAFVSEKVFYTSPQSYTARFKNSVLMPVGIDTEKFNSQNENRKRNSILSLGRISPIKNIDILVGVAILLDDKGIDFVLDIVGGPVNPEDVGYLESLKKKAEKLISKGKVNFLDSVDQDEAVILYQSHQIFVNLTPGGSMDKTILEAISCGCTPIVANDFYKSIGGVLVTGLYEIEISEKLEDALILDQEGAENLQKKLRQYVINNHSLSKLVEVLSLNIQTK